jgi:hypothetical protein
MKTVCLDVKTAYSGTGTVLSSSDLSDEEPDNSSIRNDEYTVYIPDYMQYTSEDKISQSLERHTLEPVSNTK